MIDIPRDDESSPIRPDQKRYPTPANPAFEIDDPTSPRRTVRVYPATEKIDRVHSYPMVAPMA
jgi:hypothetical protein